jgi:glutamate dehydrogenase
MENREQGLESAVHEETERFEEYYHWLENSMPKRFFERVDRESVALVVYNLLGFHLQDYFAQINMKSWAIVLCLDAEDADVKILERYRMHGISHYRAFISKKPLPDGRGNLRIATIYFTELGDIHDEKEYPIENLEELHARVKKHYPEVTNEEFEQLSQGMNARFLNSLSVERLTLALAMYFRAKTRDYCQYEVGYNFDWKENDQPSFDIVLAWRNTPKYNFLYRIALMVYRHGLVVRRVNATYINPFHRENILILGLRLHGTQGKAAWDVADVSDFMKELVTLKYSEGFDVIEDVFVNTGLLSGNFANLLRSMVTFVHQILSHLDVYQYSFENVQEAICRHPELTIQLCEAFKYKFDPEHCDLDKYQEVREKLLSLIKQLDTGNLEVDVVRKNVLKQGVNFIDHTLKSNFYRKNKTAFAFRMDPQYLEHVPFKREEHFPELPYGIFFIQGAHYFGYHVRFKDLARGGLRTIFPDKHERMVTERKSVFTECYHLAYTQYKKNKDIPEGGAKGVLFLEPYKGLDSEVEILENELQEAKLGAEELKSTLKTFTKEHQSEYLYHAQRTFVESFLSLVNCKEDGTLKVKDVLDYWKKPEYIYLGPDELMHDCMIEWIGQISKYYGYRPGGSFITGRPSYGINHKQYGVTSLGVNVYMHHVLTYLGIDPNKDPFTVKITGGPDGDVAGNQIKNLHKYYFNTAKLVAIKDGSGTAYDPAGLSLDILVELFNKGLPIKDYAPNELSEGGFLLDLSQKRDQSKYVQEILCWRKKDNIVIEDWISANEANSLYRYNLHQVVADVFIPAGGRPRTINDENYTEFLDEKGESTSKAIIEGANLYLTPWARKRLENLGVLIIKDSSANKAGVISSSFEVLCGLTLGREEFVREKKNLVDEILEILREKACDEARLILAEHDKTKEQLSDISDKISKKINGFADQLLDYLATVELSKDPKNPLIRCFLNYCPPTLRNKYQKQLLERISDNHIKAVIASRIASTLVYKRGLDWYPTIVDILPLVLEDVALLNQK